MYRKRTIRCRTARFVCLLQFNEYSAINLLTKSNLFKTLSHGLRAAAESPMGCNAADESAMTICGGDVIDLLRIRAWRKTVYSTIPITYISRING